MVRALEGLGITPLMVRRIALVKLNDISKLIERRLMRKRPSNTVVDGTVTPQFVQNPIHAVTDQIWIVPK